MKFIAALLVLVAGCGGDSGSSSKPDPVPYQPEDRLVEVDELSPSLSWDKSTFLMLTDENLELKKDLLSFFESQVKVWNKSLDHGYIPHLHLSSQQWRKFDQKYWDKKGLKPIYFTSSFN